MLEILFIHSSVWESSEIFISLTFKRRLHSFTSYLLWLKLFIWGRMHNIPNNFLIHVRIVCHMKDWIRCIPMSCWQVFTTRAVLYFLQDLSRQNNLQKDTWFRECWFLALMGKRTKELVSYSDNFITAGEVTELLIEGLIKRSHGIILTVYVFL